MVENLSGFAMNVSQVALQVGVEGKLGGQAVLDQVQGTWKDLTVHVNLMADNLSSQVRAIAGVCKAIARGDFTSKV